MKRFNSLFKVFIFLTALLAGVSDVWGGTSKTVYAKAEAYSVPSTTGYIWVTIDGTSFNATRDFTKDDYYSSATSGSNWQLIGTPANKKTFTATYYAKPKEGYSFVGWYSDSNCTRLLSSATSTNCKYETSVTTEKTGSPGEVLTLYAKFTNEYEVTFDANGGTFAGGTTPVKTQTYGTNYLLPGEPTLDGATFAGWFTTKTTGGEQVTQDTPVTTASKHTLYARWNRTFCFSASVDVDDASHGSATVSLTDERIETTANSASTTAIFTATPNVTAGYRFVKWVNESDQTVSITNPYEPEITNFSTSTPASRHYKACFTNEHEVTFNANSGTFTNGVIFVSKTLTYGDNYSFPVEPTRSGWTFAGWFTAATDGAQVTEETLVTKAENHTLYAHWTKMYCFTATANVDNVLHGSATVILADECVVASGDHATTTATFTATPNPGYRFVKWMNGSSELSGDSNKPSYTVTINNYSTTTPASRNYTAYFVAKNSQTISWNADVKTNVSLEGGAVDLSDAVSVAPGNRSYELSFISSNPEILRVDGTTIVPVAQGSADIYACVIEDDDYAADTTDVALTFIVSGRATPYFTVNSEYNIKVGDSFEVLSDNHSNVALIQCASESSSDIYSFTSTTTADHGVGTVTALKEGTVRLQFSQTATDGWNGGSTDWITVNISRHTTDLTVNTSAQTIWVGDTYNPAFATNNSEVTPVFTSTNSSVAIYEDGFIRALAVGSATLTFSQPETDKWTAASRTIDVTVEKHPNPITVKFDGETQPENRKIVHFDGTTAVTFEAANTDFVVGASSNPSIATYADGTILASHNLGTATFTVTQAETDSHEAGSATFTIEVAYADDAADCYVLNDSKGANLNDNGGSSYSLSGPGKTLKVDARSTSGTNVGLEIRSGQTVLHTFNLTTTSTTYSASIPSNIRNIRLVASGGAVSYQNLSVTRLNTIESAPMTFSENTFVGESSSQNLSIYYCTANGGETKILCDNPKFVLAQTSFTIEACSDGTISIPVTYTPTTAGTDMAHLIIYNSTNRIETSITATTVKKDQTLTWAADISPMSVGKTHDNPASAALSLNYEVVAGGESVLEILNGNQVHAIAPGTATVRAYNEGDATWNPVEGTFSFTVTELIVQRIEWMQSFTNLKTTDEPIDLDAKVYVISDNGENESAELVDRPITYTSDNVSVVRVVNGNQLEIVGAGETTLTATQPGDADYLAAEIVLPVQVRVPSDGCEMFVLQGVNGKLSAVDAKVFDLTGGPAGTISFTAWRSATQNNSSGALYLSEYVDGQWSDAIWSDETKLNIVSSYGPIALSRNATQIRFYTVKGATGDHNFSGVRVTKAQYLEFTNSPEAAAIDVVFPASETPIGQTYTKTVAIRYSDIFDQLTVSHENDKFTITPSAIGNECGDHGTATISIQFPAMAEGTEDDAITITDGRKTLTIRVSATTQRNNQTITFNPASSISTTDNVTLSATATSGLSVVFELVSGEDYATVNSTGVISVLQGGGSIVVRAIQSGNDLYNPATPVEKTITINKVTPSVTTAPTVAAVTLPATLADATIDASLAVVTDNKSAAVAGTFAWADATTALVAGTNTYAAVFTPDNIDYYTTTTCDLSVTASKHSQTISWSLTENSEYNYFQSVPLNAEATSGLTVTYTSSNEAIAQIVDGAVQFIAPGVVTITASQAGNAIYEAAESVARTISIVKATPAITTTPSLVTFYVGHSLSESPIEGGVATVDGHNVEGTFSWKEDATPEIGDNYEFTAVFTPTNATFFNATECMVPVRVTPYDRVFTDNTGNHLWSDQLNWKNGFVPTVSVDVTIADTLIIDCEAIVGELTIEENAAVLVVENGSLTVDHSGTSSTGRYGDLYVRDAASVTFNGDFQLRDLYLSSLLDSHEGKSKSAQVTNPANLYIGGDVYFDLQIDATGECSPGWYDFTVPFPVDALNGVYRIENGVVRKVTNEVNYAIMSYNEALRANGQYGWKKFRGIMQPGICYTMTIDDVYPVYRFRKTKDGALNTSSSLSMTYTSGTGSSENWGWNSLGNGTLRHADLSASGINKVQVYDHAHDSYTAFSMSECSFVVGAAFFVQAVSDQSLMTLSSASHSVLRAPAAAPAYSDEHCLVLTRENSASVLDRLYLSATEESKSSYQPGHDLAKFETSTSTPQMWCDAYGVKLCDAELPLVENTVDFPLSISAPSAATYTLSVSRMVENETLYLVQDGVIIWNLSDADYTFDLAKGTNSSYSVRLIRRISQVTTDMEQLHDSATADKFLMNGALYILRDGKMYDAQGRLVR